MDNGYIQECLGCYEEYALPLFREDFICDVCNRATQKLIDSQKQAPLPAELSLEERLAARLSVYRMAIEMAKPLLRIGKSAEALMIFEAVA